MSLGQYNLKTHFAALFPCKIPGNLHCLNTFRTRAFKVYPRANGAKRRFGVRPGRELLIPLGYLHPGKCEHSEVQSHPPCHGRSTVFVLMRMRESSLISKNMADYHEKRTLKAKTKTRTTATRLQETPEKR